MNLVMLSGCFFSVEQPGSSVMFYLDVFKRMVFRGCMITKMCFCALGSPFKKPSKWLHNTPWFHSLEQPCSCPSRHQHFIVEGSFTRDSVEEFCHLCRPSAEEVYGRRPRVGEAVSSFSASYPLCAKMAAGAWQARRDTVPVIPLTAHLKSLDRIGESCAIPSLPSSVIRTAVADPRPFHEDPEWVEELADSPQFRELLRYKICRQGHVNVLECRVHKTLMKHCAKRHPNSRFITLLDSRVVLGAMSKGRSRSRAICRVLWDTFSVVVYNQVVCISHRRRR